MRKTIGDTSPEARAGRVRVAKERHARALRPWYRAAARAVVVGEQSFGRAWDSVVAHRIEYGEADRDRAELWQETREELGRQVVALRKSAA